MFDDYLRDSVTIQQSVLVDAGGGDQDETWTPILTRPARVSSVTGRQKVVYQREGFENVERVEFDDSIPRTLTKTSMRELLYASDEEQFRLLFRGRTLTIVAVIQQSHGVHDTMANVLFVDCVEAPMPVGHLDAS